MTRRTAIQSDSVCCRRTSCQVRAARRSSAGNGGGNRLRGVGDASGEDRTSQKSPTKKREANLPDQDDGVHRDVEVPIPW